MSFSQHNDNLALNGKAYTRMVCFGFEPGTVGLKTQTNLLNYDSPCYQLMLLIYRCNVDNIKKHFSGMISNLIFDSTTKPSKSCMSSSLSTSFLNQTSCAVPSSSTHFNDCGKITFPMQPSYSSNEVWNEMTCGKNGKNSSALSFCSVHQKQCPQFYKD